MMEEKWSHSVMSDSLQPHGLWCARLPWPWDFPGKNTGVGSHFLLQEIFPTPSQGLNLALLHCRQILYCLSHQGSLEESCLQSSPQNVMLSLDQITRDNHFSALVKHRHTNVECLFVKITSGKNRMSLIHICLKLSPLSHQLNQVVVQPGLDSKWKLAALLSLS